MSHNQKPSSGRSSKWVAGALSACVLYSTVPPSEGIIVAPAPTNNDQVEFIALTFEKEAALFSRLSAGFNTLSA